jgi:hypothetical protein
MCPTSSAPLRRADKEGGPFEAARVAWLAVLPIAVLTIAAIVLLGPPLGSMLFPVRTYDFWPTAAAAVRPEPTEQARYLIALAGAVLVPLAVMAATRWQTRRVPFSDRGILIGELVFVIALAWGLLNNAYYFSNASIALAVGIALAITWIISWPPGRKLMRRTAGNQSRTTRWVAMSIAIGAIVIWLLPAIQLESTIGHARIPTSYALQFTFDEALSVSNGHMPLVDFSAQYGSLWPYVTAIPLHMAGESLGAYTGLMVGITGLAMLAVYGIIRRVSHSPLGAIALFLPFLATSFFLARGTLVERYSFADYFGVFPLRYAGPYFLAWLVTRHLYGMRPRRAIGIFAVAGLVLLNNGDFGIPALGATIVALVIGTTAPRTRAWCARFTMEAIGGLAIGYATVAAVTLALTDQLPNVELLFRYARLFALAGYNMLPMPWFGFWVVIYLTFCATLAVAATRSVQSPGNRASAGVLAWIGIFGLGIGSYYVGRSDQEVLIAIFSAWSLAVVLLIAVTTPPLIRNLRVRPAQFSLFVGFGLLACSLMQLPPPWDQVNRLQTSAPALEFQPAAEAAFIANHSRPDEPVALLTNLGQRVGRLARVNDVTPYTGMASMPTKQQLVETLQRLRDADGTTVFVRVGDAWPEVLPALRQRGFTKVAASHPVPIIDYDVPTRVFMFSDAVSRSHHR